MKTWKLVSGILSILIFVWVSLQSCAVGALGVLSDNGSAAGSAGFIVAICILVSGIISIVTRNGGSKGGDLVIGIVDTIGALMALAYMSQFGDLLIWLVWCCVCGAIGILNWRKE